MEIWKSITNFENYEISNLGNIRRLPSKRSGKYRYLKLPKDFGYVRACLYREGKMYRPFVHKLVAQEFIPNPNNYPCINHKDCIRDNNRIDNLEWCTYQYNNEYAYTKGFNKRGEEHHYSKLTNEQARDILNSILSVKELSAIYNITIHTIYSIKNRKSWKHLKNF